MKKLILIILLIAITKLSNSQCSIRIDGTPTATFNSNRTISVTYTVYNTSQYYPPGAFNVYMYLSTDQSLSTSTDYLILTDPWVGTSLTTTNYPYGATYTATTSAIPNSYSGSYYLFLYIPTASTANSCTINAIRNISINIPSSCTYSLSSYSNSSPTALAINNLIVSVNASSGCSWTATSNDNWLSITAGSSGSGNGTVYFNVAENTSSSSRTGTLRIAGYTYSFTQPGQTSSCTTPNTPTSLSASASSSSSVNLSWSGSANSYDIYDCNSNYIGNTSSTSYQVNNLNASTTYSYKVRGNNGNNCTSNFTSCASATTQGSQPSCSSPTITSQSSSPYSVQANNSVSLSVSASVTTGTLSYQWQLNSGNGFSNISNQTNSTYNFTATSSMNGYTYRCVVTNNCNGSIYQTISSTITLNVTTLPSLSSFTVTAVTSCNGTQSNVVLNWTTSNNATYYQVFKGNGVKIADNLNSTTFTDTGVTKGSKLYYQIQAVNNNLTKPKILSNLISVIPNLCANQVPPPTPSLNPMLIISLTQINIGQTIRFSGNNFSKNSPIKVLINNLNGNNLIQQTFTSTSTGNLSDNSIIIDSNFSSGTYYIYAIDVATNKLTTNFNFSVKNNTKVLEDKITVYNPASNTEIFQNNVIEIRGQIDFAKPTSNLKSYTIDLFTNNSNAKIFNKTFNVTANQIRFLIDETIVGKLTNPGKYYLKIYDNSNSKISATSELFCFNCNDQTNNGFDISLEWDSPNKYLGGNPLGVACDGTARIYVKLIRKDNNPIKSISAQILDDGKNIANPNTTTTNGKIMFASIDNNNQYSEEANNATNTYVTKLNSNPYSTSFWLWYVAPDDFTQYENSLGSERTVYVEFTVNYSNGKSIKQMKEIKLIRPPLLFVHGINSDASAFENLQFNSTNTGYNYYFQNGFNYYPPIYNTYNNVQRISYKNNSSFENGAYQVSIYIKDLILNINKKGIASNKVDYIAHSMGGCIGRTILNKNILPKIYKSDLINKFITVNTPHNGSPVADFISLPGVFQSVIILKTGGSVSINGLGDESAIPRGFLKDRTILPSEGLYNLRTINGINLKKTTIKNHLIGGDIYNTLVQDNVSKDYLFTDDIYYKLLKILYYINPLNKNFKIKPSPLDIIRSFGLASYSDVIVPLKSQLANYDPTNYFFNNSLRPDISIFTGLKTFHSNITTYNKVGNKLFLLLNTSIKSTSFSNEIAEDPEAGKPGYISFTTDSTKTIFDSIIYYFDSNSIKITKPFNKSQINIDSQLIVNVELRDTLGFKKLNINFQGEIYESDTNLFIQSFRLPIDAKLGNQYISAVAYYDSLKFDTITFTYSKTGFYVQRMDTVNINLITTQNLQSIYPDPIMKEVFPQQRFSINQNAVYGTKIIKLPFNLPDISINIIDTNAVQYIPFSQEFIAKDTGNTLIIFSYKNFTDTVFIYNFNKILSVIDTPACNNSQILNKKTFNLTNGNYALDSVSVTIGANCPLNVYTNSNWLNIVSYQNKGSQKIFFYCGFNPSQFSRSANIYINNDSITIIQAGSNCFYSLDTSTKYYTFEGTSDSIFVNTLLECIPQVSSINSDWIQFINTSKPGYQYIKYTIPQNRTTAIKQGVLTIGNINLKIIQNNVVYLTLSSSAGIGGTISPIGNTLIRLDSNLTYTITPQIGYIIDSLIIDNILVSPINSYTFTRISVNHTIRVTFKPKTFPANLISISAVHPVCIGTPGSMNITTKDTSLNYKISLTNTISNLTKNYTFRGTSYTINNVFADSLYKLVILDENFVNSKREFGVKVVSPKPITAFTQLNYSHKTVEISMQGSNSYFLKINDKEIQTSLHSIVLPLQTGLNKIKITSSPTCTSGFEETIVVTDEVIMYPNPANDIVKFSVGGTVENIKLEILSIKGLVVLSQNFILDENRTIELDISHLLKGTYVVKLRGKDINANLNLLKN